MWDNPEGDGSTSYEKVMRGRSWQQILKGKIRDISSMIPHKIAHC
jgi:hypothetical protein